MKSDFVFTLENAGWPALMIDASSTICRANAAAVARFGSALEGGAALLSAIWSTENHDSAEQFLARWERSPTPMQTLKFRSKGGSSHAWLTSICAWTKDQQKFFLVQLLQESPPATTEVKALNGDSSLVHRQKLDCALQLARTVALDFNNALTSILGHTSLVLSKMESNHPWRALLLEVEKSASKAAEIANDLGTFSRAEKEGRSPAPGNLNSLLQGCAEFFQNHGGPPAAAWNLHLERRLFSAKFDEAKMQQVFMKLLENSIQAMAADPRITIQTRNIELTEPTQDVNISLAVGSHICAEVTDNGSGIEPDILPRIFEPFFTTKKGGNHRGLGLAWVYGIVTNHGGGVAVSSKPGVGTSVRIYLPAEKQIVKDDGMTGGDLNGDQTILMVDDDELVLSLGQTILSTYGYQVLTASSGKKALEILAGQGKGIDLVITDMVMPAMTGRELVSKIHDLAPGTRIICTSGYVWSTNQEGAETYLQKPFTSQGLLRKVKQALAVQQPA
jgi:two-component system, cell cycle sensor histidine kinase and response regulator CckA